MIVIGTAGHIDHGKSSIVKQLTGTDPDRLPEEKERGMTIDLGFAFYRTPNNETIAIVDVPGHERFVKNMIAGAGGIDVAMLVIAADDGWMPQSTEHFHIIRLLGIRHGLIVINKSDLVPLERIKTLTSEIRSHVAGSFLADAPTFTVSAITGTGFDELRTFLDNIPGTVASREDIGKPRLCIDRAFIRPGIGGVATGTLRGGTLHVGQEVTLWPSGTRSKIRTLQSNNATVETAQSGQRTALSLTGVDKTELVRGGVISDRIDLTYLQEHPVLALQVELLPDSLVVLENRRRVLLLAGTAEVEGEIRTWNNEAISPRAAGYCFFIPETPLYTLVGDSVILRLPTPMVTIGGGCVLDHLAHVPKLRDLPKYEYLRQRNVDNIASLIQTELEKQLLASKDTLLSWSNYSTKHISGIVTSLINKGDIQEIDGYLYATEQIQKQLSEFRTQIEAHIQANAQTKGIRAEQAASLFGFDTQASLALLRVLVKGNILEAQNDLFVLKGASTAIPVALQAAYTDVMKLLQAEPFTPPTLASLADKGKAYREAIRFMLDSGEVHKCGADFLFVSSAWQEIISFVKERLRTHATLSVSDMKNRFGFSRKYAVPILEETDRLKLTRREGDMRVKGEMFEA